MATDLHYFGPGVAVEEETWAAAQADGATDLKSLGDWLELHPEHTGILLSAARVRELCLAEINNGNPRGKMMLNILNATLKANGHKTDLRVVK